MNLENYLDINVPGSWTAVDVLRYRQEAHQIWHL